MNNNTNIQSTSKTALVTGASRGLGKAFAQDLASKGYQVVGTATSDQGAAEITKELSKISPNCFGMKLVQQQEEDVDKLFADLKEKDITPDILVANAGITADNIILRMKSDEWHKVMDINLTGNFYLARSAVKLMIKARWGRIIFVGSVVGSIGNLGQANYAAAKAGLIGFGKSLAREFATRNISVNIIAPGFIQTDMTDELDEKIKEELLKTIPMNRYGSTQEVAGLVSFLASDEAGYITGQVIHVNGGMY